MHTIWKRLNNELRKTQSRCQSSLELVSLHGDTEISQSHMLQYAVIHVPMNYTAETWPSSTISREESSCEECGKTEEKKAKQLATNWADNVSRGRTPRPHVFKIWVIAGWFGQWWERQHSSNVVHAFQTTFTCMHWLLLELVDCCIAIRNLRLMKALPHCYFQLVQKEPCSEFEPV